MMDKVNYQIDRNWQIIFANVIYTLSLWVALAMIYLYDWIVGNWIGTSLYEFIGLAVIFAILIYGKCIYEIRKLKAEYLEAGGGEQDGK